MTEEKAHSVWGASGLFKWGNCPGSIRLERPYPNESSPDALLGTKAHALAETLARAAIMDNWKLNGTKRAVERATFMNRHAGSESERKEAYDMLEAAEVYVNYLRTIVQKASAGSVQVFIEHGFNLSWLRPKMFGTCDAVIIIEYIDNQTGEICTELHVIDFKYGQGIMVGAKENDQLAYYGLGAKSDFSLLYNFTRVVLHIVQPRIENIDSWETTPAWLDDFGVRLGHRYDATLADSAPLNAGPWCKKNFCRARHNCPKLIETAIEVAKTEFAVAPLVREVFSDDATAMQVIQIVRTWADAREADIKKKLLANLPTTASTIFKVVIGRSSRSWAEGVEAKFPHAKFPALWEEPTFRSPAQIEKVVGKEKYEEHFDSLVLKKPGAPTIVPIEDARKALDKTEQARLEFSANPLTEENPLSDLLG